MILEKKCVTIIYLTFLTSNPWKFNKNFYQQNLFKEIGGEIKVLAEVLEDFQKFLRERVL